MTDEELRARMKEYVMGWKEVGEFLEAERRDRVRRTDTSSALRRLARLFNSAVYLHPPEPSSGLVEFYRILGRSRS
jgi:hypothetical protein